MIHDDPNWPVHVSVETERLPMSAFFRPRILALMLDSWHRCCFKPRFGVPKYALRFLKVSLLDIAFLAIYPCLLDITPLQIIVQAENEWEHHLFHTARVQDCARSLVVFTCEHYISGFRPIWIVKCKLIIKSGWWFQTFFIFHDIWDNPSQLIIFQDG